MSEIVLKNPITNWVKDSIDASINQLSIAVPFLSSFATSIFTNPQTKKIIDKRLVTRFDDSSISSFELPTLKSLLDIGFQIRFDNTIHLKLYITDSDAFVTSSNLTKSGFEDNIELTVKVDSENTKKCIDIFDELWENCKQNVISSELIDSNWGKFEILKKREQIKKTTLKKIVTTHVQIGDLNIEDIINEILNKRRDYHQTIILEYKANQLREKTKTSLMKKGFDRDLFYVDEFHPKRKRNLFYDFVYGHESNLAGTGLRELQYRVVFKHPDLEKVINYIYPEIIGMQPWNFQDRNILLEFCKGIFDFNIPQYSEAIPIRLASYFYPAIFLPIFKLDHMQNICEILGLGTNAETKGERLYAYNLFLSDKLKSLPFDNFIKMDISYLILYTVQLYNRLVNNEMYDVILSSYSQRWKKQKIEEGREILLSLKGL